MKLRVLGNSLRGKRVVAMVFGGLFGLLIAVITLLTGLARFDDPSITVDLMASLYAGWLVGWVLAPVATGGGDETLRPEHFALLPIGKRKLAAGLLAASFVGVPAVVSLVAFLGLFVYGLTFGAGPAIVGLLFAVLQLVFTILVYRVVMALLGALLSTRKGKDLGIALIALLGLSGVGVNYVLNALGPAIIDGRASEFAAVVRVLPSGWGAVAVGEAGIGNWLGALLLLLAMVTLIAGLLALWGVLLVRRTTNTTFRGSSGKHSAKADGPKRRSPLPDTPIGAVARKELRTWQRDTRRRVALLGSVMIGVVITVVPSASGTGGQGIAYLGVLVVFFACMQSANLYGYDGSALWHTLVTPGAERADVRGRQLAWALIIAPLGLVLAAVLPAVVSSPSAYPWVFGLLPAVLGAGTGTLMLQSVFAATAMPDPRRNASPLSTSGRPGCANVLLSIGLMFLLAFATLPVFAVLVAGAVADLPALMWAGVPVGIATGSVLAWWWGAVAVNRLVSHGPELLATVTKER
jgi:ABC-2 type transport system permease protein